MTRKSSQPEPDIRYNFTPVQKYRGLPSPPGGYDYGTTADMTWKVYKNDRF